MPTFAVFKFPKHIEEYLAQKQIHTPSSIQEKAFSLMTPEKHNFYIVAPTGTGKTLTYLLPLVAQLKLEEEKAEAKLTRPNRPRALIIVSSKELVIQIADVCKQIAHHSKFKVGTLGTGSSFRQQRQMLNQGVDILVTTLDRLESLREHAHFSLLSHLVIDEADTLADSGNQGKIENLVQTLKIRQFKALETGHPIPTMMFVSATFTPSLEKFFAQTFKNFERDERFYSKQQLHAIKQREEMDRRHATNKADEGVLRELALHKIVDKNTHLNLQNIKHEFIHCGGLDKHEPILTLLKRLKPTVAAEKSSILIFCTSVKSLHELEYFLNSQKINVATLHGELPKHARLDNFSRFRNKDSGVSILLTTDLGSRGLDFEAVNNVINYDFPQSLSDYLHRAGRTGRAGRKGVVYTLYHNKNLDMINELRACHEQKRPLNIRESAYSLANKQTLQDRYKRRSTRSSSSSSSYGRARTSR